jgi:hypothetical protein
MKGKTMAAIKQTSNTVSMKAARSRVPLFPVGGFSITSGACDRLEELGGNPFDLILRHQTGDWGMLCPEDRQANLNAIKHGGRIFSSYGFEADKKARVWVITEADRSATTVLTPEEY